MARSPSSWEGIVNVAKIQLDYPASTQDPQVLNALVSELEKHIRLYPHDLNFFVTPHINNGYGAVNCLERGCQDVQIPLIARLDAPHDGRDVGLGSLSAYRRHIVEDPAHVESRNDRLAGGEGAAPNPFGPHIPGPSTAQPSRFASGSQAVKSEPLEPFIPQKRLWGSSSIWDPSSRETFKVEHGDGPNLGTPNAKKVKLEAPKTPLTPLNREPSFNAIVPPAPTPAAENHADDTRERLGEVQGQIRAVEAKLYKAQVKAKKTKADYTRILKFRNELSSLQALKDKYNASLPSMKPISRPGSGVRLSPVKPSVPSGSGSTHLPPPFQNPAYNNGIVHNVDMDMIPQPYVQPGRVASGSNVKLEAPPADPQPYDEDLYYQDLDAGEPVYLNYTPDDERFDEDGDFFGRGKDRFAGPIAKADDIDKFLVAAGNTEQFDGNASVEKALAKLGLQSIYQLPHGMEVALMPHQAIGVAWMLEKERSDSKGGCLADEMGLGKTVQMIATMVLNRSQDALRRTTLILCPVALLDQWQQEIELKTNLGFKCLIYHGNTKVKRPQEFRIYDVVLTTFQTLSFEWPDDEAEERRKKRLKKANNGFIVDDDEDNKANVKTRGRKTLGPLFEFDWYFTIPLSPPYRIVLDEAQNIRNKRTRVSRAVTKLEATYRWCLTGTPIINGLADAYAPIRFLRLRPWYDWTEFNRHITLREKKNPELATRRLQAIFATMLLRRKKDSMLDGQRLIELPNKQVHLEQLQFSQEERDVYTMVESRSQEIFNRFLRAGTVLKNYHQVLVLLLRLRQVCAHPCLITESGAAFISPGEVEDTNGTYAELARAQRSMGPEFVINMKEKFKVVALERMQAERDSPDATPEGEEYDCPICFDGYTDAVITGCGHTFCRECIMNVLNGPQREDAHAQNQYTPEERPCPVCRGPIAKEKLFLRSAFEPTDAELGVQVKDEPVPKHEQDEIVFVHEQPQAPKGRIFRKRSVRSYAGSDDEDDNGGDDDLSDFIVEDDEDEEEAEARIREKRRVNKGKGRAIVLSDDEDDADIICGARPDYVNLPPEKIKLMNRFLPSTKMKHMMESLRKWAEEHPDEKTLIISQWTSCLQLVSDYLTENGFLHVKYQGDMSRAKRDQAVRVFMAKDKAAVMLMSMKCGGVGLNLTRANRVISLDLGWSEAVESQAFDRVHRLGQLRDVSVHRLVIAGTVEDRILALQQRKKLLADCSLGEGTGKKIGKLSVKELANLFGLDHRGNALQPAQAQ